MGKVVQEDGRVLLIAVLEVSWSKWWVGCEEIFTAEATGIGGKG